MTGFGLLANLSGRTGPLTAMDHALDIAVDDPNLDFILFSGVNLPEARPPDEATARRLEGRLDWLAQRMASAPIPVIPVGATCVNVSDYGRELLTTHGLNVLGGLNLGVTALGHALRWLENRGPGPGRPGRRGRPAAGRTGRDPGPGPRRRRAGCWPPRACRWCPAGWPARPPRPSGSPGRSGCRWP